MTKTDKLIKVFDFIAEYLYETEDNVDNQNIIQVNDVELKNNGEDSLKRAYTLMKKLDERDRQNATVVTEIKKATEPLKEELNRIKKEYEEQLSLDVIEEIKEGYNADSLSNQIEVTSKTYKKKSTSKGVISTVEPKPTKSILEK
jgi:hypothetical protein